MEEPRPTTATLDINLLHDKALGRQGEAEFDQIVDLAKQGKLKAENVPGVFRVFLTRDTNQGSSKGQCRVRCE